MVQKRDLGKEILTRGVEQAVPLNLAEEKLRSGKKLRVYWGIDPTGAKLHLGHTVPLRKLQQFVDAGHEVIMLIGSFTAMVGDPSGRDTLREPLTRKQVEKNFVTYQEQATRTLDFTKVQIVYNHEWLEKMQLEDIMNLASHFTVQQMLQRDMFQERMSWKVVCTHCQQQFNSPIQFKDLESFATAQLSGNTVQCPHCSKVTPCNKENILPPSNPVSPTEFIYPLLQGYDSVVLDVDCEVGGNDQLFNMLCGRKLQKVFGKRDKFVIAMRLLEGTDGRKMSKTYNNCIYLEDSPSEMYGKVMSIRDDLILSYMECCTDVSIDDLNTFWRKRVAEGGEPAKLAKMELARQIVTLYHNKRDTQSAEWQFVRQFQHHDTLLEMDERRVSSKIYKIVDLLFMTELVSSKSEGRRMIQQNAVKVDSKKISEIDAEINLKKATVLQVGSRRFCKVIPT